MKWCLRIVDALQGLGRVVRRAGARRRSDMQGTGFLPCAVAALGMLAMAGPLRAAEFAGGGIGAITDNNPAGINITFNVSGSTQPLSHLRLKLGLTHTYVGDLRATLISPAGVARLVIFDRLGYRGATALGVAADLGGSYVFDDAGGDLFATLAPLTGSSVVPSGVYRTSTGGLYTGGLYQVNDRGGCTTSLNGAFAGLSASQSNGTWTLNIADVAVGDTGTVTSALLSLDDGIFQSGVDSPIRGTCKLAWMDMTGSGRTSFVMGSVVGGTINWTVADNSGSGAGIATSFLLGEIEDDMVTGDWDGDGIYDAAIWKAGATAASFQVRRSSRPLPLLVVEFGQLGDNPTAIGDYDGDGRSDFAVFRPAAAAGGISRTLIRPSAGGPDRDWVTGGYQSFTVGGVDFNGDGNADIAIQSAGVGGVGNFRYFDALTGSEFANFNFGFSNSFVVTGNHVGNAIADATVTSDSGGIRSWTSRDGATQVVQPAAILGANLDKNLGGDYDGDGLDDDAVWRSSTTPNASKFIIRRSTAPATPLEVLMGQSGNYPVGNNRVH